MFKGSIVAIVTPFNGDAQIDEAGFAKLIDFQIQNGTQGIVPCGTTGESATLSHEEHEHLIKLTIEIVGHRVPVIAGTGSNSTQEAIMLTKAAKTAGADGSLLITPYYNKPTQAGLYQHFKAVAEAVDIPIVLYNVPGRTGVNMLPATVAKLAQIPNIVGIKEASGSVQQMSEIIKACGDRITLLSGDDFLTLPALAIGGQGVISVVANIVPDKVAALITNWETGDIAAARKIHHDLYPLYSAMFIETNPIPVKTSLALMGKISGSFRLPLCPMEKENLAKLKGALATYGLI